MEGDRVVIPPRPRVCPARRGGLSAEEAAALLERARSMRAAAIARMLSLPVRLGARCLRAILDRRRKRHFAIAVDMLLIAAAVGPAL